MNRPPRIGLSEAEKDALLLEQAALIERLSTRISELEALVGKPGTPFGPGAGQQELGKNHQVCLAHVPRDLQYAIDSGDAIFAPKIRDHLRWAISVGERRIRLKDTTLATYAAKADDRLHRLLGLPVAHPAGKDLKKQIKAWRTKFFVFMTHRDVPATNNISEREIHLPSAVFRKVTNGFRSDWGAHIHAAYRSATGTARLSGKPALDAIRDLVAGNFALA